MVAIKKGDFVELKFTGYSQGQIFDSNIEEDLRKITEKPEVKKIIVVVGEGMVVSGLDKSLEGKEVGNEYTIKLSPKEAFGERDRTMMKTIPLKAFTERNVYPQAGMMLNLDGMIARIIAVSGARVMTDFNNPLAGKDVEYKFSAIRKVDNEEEKIKSLFESLMKFVPEYEIKDKIVVKGSKGFEFIVKAYSDKFKQLIGKELTFELKEEKKSEKVENKTVEEKKI